MDCDEFRQPLWVHLTLSEHAALKLSEAPNLPDGYRYERVVCSGSGGRTQTRVQMVELHVDDADAFDAHRAASPYGGDFSVRSGLVRLPSAPPVDLPNPAEDTLSMAEAEALAEAAAEVARAVQAVLPTGAMASATPAVQLQAGHLKAMKVPELRAICEAKGLETGGVKKVLIERLTAFLAGEAAPDEDDAETYNVLKVHAHRIVENQLQYLVEWKGWDGEQTWEKASSLHPIPPHPIPSHPTPPHPVSPLRTPPCRRSISMGAMMQSMPTTRTQSTESLAVAMATAQACASATSLCGTKGRTRLSSRSSHTH